MPESDYKLLTLFFIFAACLILRASVESTGYCTPDSIYYLEVAENLLKGNGFYHSQIHPKPNTTLINTQTYLAIWPLGYPSLIAITAFLFSIPVFWASKVVNLIFLGLCLLLFRKINREKAYLMGITFGAFTFMEVFTYTWSEGPYLFWFLYLGYTLYQLWIGKTHNSIFVSLFFCCLFLFLLRYIGGSNFLIVGGLSLWFYLKKNFKVAFKLFTVFSTLSVFGIFYLYHNYLNSGFITGMERLVPTGETTGVFIAYLLKGIFNEFFIIKNYYFRSEPVALFLLLAVFQAIIFLLVYFRLRRNKKAAVTQGGKLIQVYIFIGLYYLGMLIFLRRLSPFDAFDYRLLSPFTICMYLALWLFLFKNYPKTAVSAVSKYLILLFGFSLLMNLPKVYLIETFLKIYQK